MTAPPSLTTGSDAVVVVPGTVQAVPDIVVHDADPNPIYVFSIVAAASLGTLAARVTSEGGSVTGSGTRILTIEGTLAQVNASVATLTYTAVTPGNDSIALSINDGQGGVTNTSIAVTVSTVNHAPAFSGVCLLYTSDAADE